MRAPREITPHARAEPLLCAEFRQDRSYTNWRPRGTNDWLLIYTLEGAGRIVADGRSLRAGRQSAVLFRPGVAQDYSTDTEAGHWAIRWAHFVPKPHWQPWLIWPEFERGVGTVQLGEEIGSRVAAALDRMLITQRLGGEGATDLAMNALEEALLWAHRSVAGDRWLRIDPRIHRAMSYLAAQPERPFSLTELARHCGLSESRLSHLFKLEVGSTPRTFSEKLRLEIAAQLLVQTGLSVRQIAGQTGFADPLYFSRRFRHIWGTTPKEHRAAAAHRQPG